MRNEYEARPRWDDGLPTWRPQPGEVLAGVIDRATISETPQGLVLAVIVTEERTDERGLSTARLDERAGAVRAASAPPWGTDRRALPVARPGPYLAAVEVPHGPPREARFFAVGEERPTRRPGTGRSAGPSAGPLIHRRPHEPEPHADVDARRSRPLGDPSAGPHPERTRRRSWLVIKPKTAHPA